MPSQLNKVKLMDATQHKSSRKAHNPIEGREFWEDWIGRYQSSSQTRKAFCRDNNLNYDRFQYWHNKLKQENQSAKKLIPIKTTTSCTKSAPLCTVALSQGHQLHIFDRNLLSQILSSIM